MYCGWNEIDAPESRTTRILIAEDDPGNREALQSLVETLGYGVTAVPDGTAALAAIGAAPPDLVLSDVHMPGLGGFELCRRLKADPATRLIPIVLVTALGEDFKADGIEAGADDFLGKPVNLASLTLRLRSLLRMRAFTDELESAEAVLFSLATSVEARDAPTDGHCERLAALAVALGRRLGLGNGDLRALHRGGYLHDLGKIAIPDAILLKPGPLAAQERAIMQRHPLIGEEICRPLRSLHAVRPIIRHHHERWNGSGYPDGLRGEAIPLTARILQVVDVYDALRSDRPYRAALSPAAAMEVLAAETRAGWCDPAVVAGFAAIADATETPRAAGE
jgi:putative two-component system response regulator